MQGMDRIRLARRDGYAPPIAWIETEPGIAAWLFKPPGNFGHLRVWVEPTDSVRRLDLRPLVGLVCCVSGNDADRVSEVAEAVDQAGAARVITATMQPAPWGQFDLAAMTDSAGIHDWSQRG